jgi:hypothetical protein
MIIKQESQSDFLRGLLKSPQLGLPDYSADPIVQRRVGRAIAETSSPITAGATNGRAPRETAPSDAILELKGHLANR